jgi:uncharacterized protein YjbJ (UPF0337 family)
MLAIRVSRTATATTTPGSLTGSASPGEIDLLRRISKSEEGAAMARNKTRDKVEGKADKAKGRIKESTGAATGNESQRTEGITDRAKGALKSKRGHLKDLVD